MDLSSRLREGTKEAHKRTESAVSVGQLLKGIISRKRYREYLGSLHTIYQALEDALEENASDPLVAPIRFPELYRIPGLEEDLEFYYGPAWEDMITDSPASKRYRERLNELSENDPGLLAAHAYTRYLGDLSGGQFIKKGLKLTLRLTDEGLAFYEFQVPSLKAAKDNFRAGLDSLPIDEEMADRIVAEANVSFDLTYEVFGELGKKVK